eukprot:CAMPEP_0182456208 /NCGR_PEP_ID=MMETSP1319-20130603/2112_1 /TAXON_ID=172717 /ORGANISM="Bolidomonas pacifica, Strain RCC208" /LENGTH=171 /DNA_ID=CAMNT_0024654399 /DNA_START=38 /DNA_END=549 /DNA_ORIENTATION=-
MGKFIVAMTFAILGTVEFINAVQCLIDPKTTATALEGVIAVEDATDAWGRSYAWALWGLGSVRIMYALNPLSSSAWFFTLATHMFEGYFWWSSALGRTGAVLEAHGAKLIEGQGHAEQIVKTLLSVREVSPAIIHHVLLFGVPLLCLLLLVNAPNKSGGSGSGGGGGSGDG